ncbi:hypothetical protein UT300007_28500 [Clostridium sp. CTA-7]
MLLFTYNLKNGFIFSYNALGIPLPHSITSIILFCISILIGYKNRENHYGKAGMALSTIFLGFIAISSLI